MEGEHTQKMISTTFVQTYTKEKKKKKKTDTDIILQSRCNERKPVIEEEGGKSEQLEENKRKGNVIYLAYNALDASSFIFF